MSSELATLDDAAAAPKRWVVVAKIAAAVAILAYLVLQAQRHEGFARLVEEPKNWRMLIGAVGVVLISATLSFWRWHMLVRALGLRFRLLDAMRLGSLGFAMNFVALGTVGGDVFKAVFIAREQPGKRTEAVATVAVDRLLGLFTMLILASVVVLTMDLGDQASAAVKLLCQATLTCTAFGMVAIALVLYLPGISHSGMIGQLNRIPFAGPIVVSLLSAVQVYRSRKLVLLAAVLLSLVVDSLYAASFYCVSQGLPVHAPTLLEHLFVVPLSVIAGAIPITPNGLGTLEAAVEALYQAVPSGAAVIPGDGTIVALGHRICTMFVAGVGMVFYATQRAQMRAATGKPPAVDAGMCMD